MFRSKFLVYLIPVIFSSITVTENKNVTKRETDCDVNVFCGDCLQQLGCVWCIEPVYSSSLDKKTHCMAKNSIDQDKCPINILVNPNSTQDIISQKPLQSTQDNHVQITPQKINLTMRLGEERQINFEYAQAKNYPIDLYYIMDYSASMETHRVELAKLGNKLAETMRQITSNFRIGFGSFVDKVQTPFTNTLPAKLKSPCTLNKANQAPIKCAPPYSFKNHMSLSQNYTKFSQEVSEAKISGNVDTPEGGFDAIMQAIVCKDEIGWRDHARHLLVFSTDAEFHIGGDGKLVGVLQPNDAQCHMSNNEYHDYLTYDYPSVSQLNYIVKKNNINLIFAIVKTEKDVLDSYIELSKNIENSNVGPLDERSENVIDLVLENYNKIVDTVVIDIHSGKNTEVRLTSNCSKPKANGCSDIHLEEIVNFTVSIKPLTCEGHNGEPITLKPEAIDESLIIELNLICGCDCEKSGSPYNFQNSSWCQNSGDLVCGICKCSPGKSGEQCECDGRESHSHNITNCVAKPGAQECSGLGKCTCGKCECFKRPLENEKVYGKYCQCDNYSCNQKNGLLCAGKGTCSCGKCVCDAGWEGNACECPDGNSTCIDSSNNQGVCSGRGVCKCGKCICSETYYTGQYCEKCHTCKDRCAELKNCVECKVFQTGPLTGKECDLKCSAYTIKEEDEINEEKGGQMCRSIDAESCTIRYKYSYDLDKYYIITVEKQKSCPPNVLAWILALIGTIVLAGIIMLLIWKIFTTLHDRREYVKFENERMNMKWHRSENPLYKNATTTFHNPVYSK